MAVDGDGELGVTCYGKSFLILVLGEEDVGEDAGGEDAELGTNVYRWSRTVELAPHQQVGFICEVGIPL